jgi:hypothetical protein
LAQIADLTDANHRGNKKNIDEAGAGGDHGRNQRNGYLMILFESLTD